MIKTEEVTTCRSSDNIPACVNSVNKKKKEEEEAVVKEFKLVENYREWLLSSCHQLKNDNFFGKSDILCGRGNNIMNHPGNIVLKSIVMSKLDEYILLSTGNGNKSAGSIKLTWDVVHLLKNKYGARFLKFESSKSPDKNGNYLPSSWIEVSNEEARLKVRYAFRDRVRKKLKNKHSRPYCNR